VNQTASKTPTHPIFLTVNEAAEMLRVKPRTIYEMVSDGRIPFRKAGRRTIFLLDELIAWTAGESGAGEQDGGSGPGLSGGAQSTILAPCRRRLQLRKRVHK
jgi:excisionase family DNA binding protein